MSTIDLQTASDTALADHVWTRRSEMVYRAKLSVLYHAKRGRFYDTADRWVSALTAISATAAVVAVLKSVSEAEKWVAALTAVLSLLPLLWGPAQRGFRHAELSANFRRLLGQMEAAGEVWTVIDCDRFAAAFAELEAAEPAPMSALMADCQNQLSLAVPVERRAKLIKLNRIERWFKNWFDFDAVRLASR